MLKTWAALAWLAAAPHNPVLPGDYPDPSVIRVGGDYWATATTSGWAPIFPILHSTDLLHWTTAGAVFADRPAWSEGSYWAPEISARGTRYFVYYTARKKGGPLCVAVATADAPAGPYTDRGPLVCQEAGSIDAFPVTGEDGRDYLVWKEDGNSRKLPTPLWIQPLSADGAKLVGERRELLRNDAPWEGPVVEGPDIVRRNGWFYLFYSGSRCCGAGCDYALGVARARRLLGPWEKYPRNPILSGNATWKCPGHGTLVERRDGRTFLLYHAYDAKQGVFTGRQGLLDEVIWDASGWPSINAGAGPGGRRASLPEVGDDWSWPAARKPRFHIENGRLSLIAGEGAAPVQAVLARRVAALDYQATVAVDAAAEGAVAGLAAYGDSNNWTGIFASREGLRLWRKRKGEARQLAFLPLAAESLHLRLEVRGGSRQRFSYSRDGAAWTAVPREPEPWDLAVRVALTAGGAPGAAARFEAFTLRQGFTGRRISMSLNTTSPPVVLSSPGFTTFVCTSAVLMPFKCTTTRGPCAEIASSFQSPGL